MKKNILGKIAIIVLAVICVSFVLINFIPVNFKISIHDNDINYARLYHNGTVSSVVYKESSETKFNEIIKKYNEIYKIKISNALFGGYLNYEEELDNTNTNYNVYTSLLLQEGKTYIEFGYSDEKSIIYRGKEYDDPRFSSQRIETCKAVIIELTNSETPTLINIYYVNSSNNSAYKTTTYAIPHDLQNYVENFVL